MEKIEYSSIAWQSKKKERKRDDYKNKNKTHHHIYKHENKKPVNILQCDVGRNRMTKQRKSSMD
ncbi:hypothetical protein FACS189472_18200 [Alphaproteobacteria bacterium]|nr:hypothetical protein FACS189472_18200 [Alphaproteobacteria bacterium]